VYKNKRVFRYNRKGDSQIGGTLFNNVGAVHELPLYDVKL
jgi:hypothetical protein